MNKFATLLLTLFFCQTVYSQSSIQIVVKDSSDQKSISGAIITISGTKKGTTTDENGKASILVDVFPAKLSVRMFGYFDTYIPLKDSTIRELSIVLSENVENLNEVTISTTRSNARIEDLPMKVEVLGQEEMDEESAIVPGGIGSILGDLSVITVQKTNAINGNDGIRMQGLDSKYTLLLRDGIPLYEGFSGSLGVLSIPPLDLKQIEIIKGSASTLYGGGAIGGLINFISKQPTDSPSISLLFNHSDLNENNFNLYGEKKIKNNGFTILSGVNIRDSKDINHDGYAEIPEDKNFTIHPRYFFNNNHSVKADAGLNFNSDERRSGTTVGIRDGSKSKHHFLQSESTLRLTGDLHFEYKINDHQTLSVKAAASSFQRQYQSSATKFDGTQITTYSEANYCITKGLNTIITGLNYNFDHFIKSEGDSIYFPSYFYNTVGAFAQDVFKITDQLSVESGIRIDKHSQFGLIILPSEGLFYKPTEKISVRLHYGSGYKTPNNFTTATPEQLKNTSIIGRNVKCEISHGLNMDIGYHTIIGEKLSLQIDQAFYYTGIYNPTYLKLNYNGIYHLLNNNNNLQSIGTDTYIRLSLEEWELYLGFNHTKAKEIAYPLNLNLPYNPNDKFATTLAYTIENKWRMGIEAAYNANQYNASGKKVDNYWFMAAMIERKFKKLSFVLNCENLTDFRQSSNEDLVTIVNGQPVFTDIWAPTEGRTINLSIKLVF